MQDEGGDTTELIDRLLSELKFVTSRSSGPGGQNVNKVNSKVIIKFDLWGSFALSDEQKSLVATKLASHLTKEGILIIAAQEDRSQLANKQTAIAKFRTLIARALRKPKVRKATKPSKSSVAKRLNKKKANSEKKQLRRPPTV